MISSGIDGLDGSDYEVVVVGAGPLGISLSLELARSGVKVLLLESGGDQPSPERQELSRGTIVDPRVHDELEITGSRRLGGASNLWGARCQPFDPIDFHDRSDVLGVSWPVSHDEIAPYFPRAAVYANCGEAIFRAPQPELDAADSEVDATRMERFSARPAFQKAHAEELSSTASLTVRLEVTVSEIAHEEGRVTALTLNDKQGRMLQLPVKRAVLAMGGLETTRLLLATQAKEPALFGGSDGPLGRFYMAHVIGEVADVVWKSKSVDEAYDFFLDGRGSYARRRMIPSDAAILDKRLPNVSFWPVVPPVADARHRSAILSMVFLSFAFKPLGGFLVAEAIRRYHAPSGTPKWPHIWNVVRGLPSAVIYAGQFLKKRYLDAVRIPGFFVRSPAMVYGLSYHAEHFPSRESRVSLNDERDIYGLPRLTVDLKFSTADAEALVRAHEHLDAWLKRNQLGEIRYRQDLSRTAQAILDAATHGNHQIGLARMGSNAQEAVVDSNLETFSVRGLYLATVAVFPTSSQANPTFTGVAFSIRLAEHLKEKISES